jgi:hypothetical protein
MIIEIGPDGQLGSPTDLAFDNEGNLYVCDTKYHHVQKFTLIDNRPCSEMSLGSSDFLISIEFFFSFLLKEQQHRRIEQFLHIKIDITG